MIEFSQWARELADRLREKEATTDQCPEHPSVAAFEQWLKSRSDQGVQDLLKEDMAIYGSCMYNAETGKRIPPNEWMNIPIPSLSEMPYITAFDVQRFGIETDNLIFDCSRDAFCIPPNTVIRAARALDAGIIQYPKISLESE